jgi:hypothetical protein
MSFDNHKLWRRGLLALFLVVAGIGQAAAQDANGTISGTVADEQGQVVPGATVTLINENTKLSRTAVTDARGDFRFPTLLPGTYTVKVELQGFKTFEGRSNVLNASSTLSLGTLKLALGNLSEVIVVEDSGTKVNVEETQHSGLLTSKQIEQLQSKGRDVVNLLRTLPGVRYGGDTDALGDSFGTQIPNINGQRDMWNKSTVDGMTATESGGAGRIGTSVSLDAIAEVKVLLNTYRAEFGGTGGAQIQIVTKAGGSDYRGTMYWLGRRTSWNANRWEGNRSPTSPTDPLADCNNSWTLANGSQTCAAGRPTYNFNTYGFNLGGPIPGQKEKKLFFFYNLEVPLQKRDTVPRRYMVPTEAERNGDFSNTFQFGQTTNKVTVLDPVTGNPLPNNRVPANLIDPNMQALMRMYPLPNRTDMSLTNNQYNYETTLPFNNPRQNHTLRLDWKPTNADTIFVSGLMHRSLQEGGDAPGFNVRGKWGLYNPTYDFGNAQVNVGHTRIFGSHVINELQAGYRNQWEKFGFLTDADRARLSREGTGYNGGQFFPGTNTNGFIPLIDVGGMTLGTSGQGGATEAANFTYDSRNGETANDYILSLRDNLTWTKQAHTFKAGILYEHFKQNEARGGNYTGTFTFNNANRATNPLSSTIPYANFLMGAFTTYTEIDGRQDTGNRQGRLEWYVQDTWKASRRLTLDLGVRFLWYQQWYQGGDILHAAFAPERYALGASPRLYVPGDGAAVDPRNPSDRRTPTAAFQGRFVPGSGNAGNGMVLSNDETYPRGFRDQLGVHPEPTIGLAYDVFGNGKTNLHAGGRLAHQGYMGGGYQGNLRGVPAQNVVAVPNNLTSQFLSTAGFSGPSGVGGLQRDAKTPSAYSFSLGVTQDIGWGAALDVSYVGVLNRHLDVTRNINAVPAGANCLGATAAPCAAQTSVQSDVRTINLINPLTGQRWPSDDFRRPYEGFQDIGIHEHWGTANYNGLQLQLTRRYIKGLQFSLAYTFSKALGINDNDPGGNAETLTPSRLAQYYAPLSHNQTHNFVANFTYDFPKVGGPAPVHALLSNWQISSEYVWASGDWAGVTLDMNPNVDFTGGTNCQNLGCEGGATVVVVGNPRNSGGSPFDPNNPWFNLDAFAAPTVGNTGNAQRTLFQLPPISNLNVSLFKNIALGHARRVQLRLEGYNVLNHTQISQIGTTLQYNAAGVLTNRATQPGQAGPGMASAARAPRILQASVRLSF